ncbi:MgtC/SapB family protein [Ammoniphilus resinae]|uniref:Mg2+ transporter-C (MgtC) family protein n=1 Tax=Ammoniphilus resinae TaxID=861532 RepID=A0ABS4GTZ8_9BACL|nr:MgtC/SapB family protein [Ammoniphilus resinae]MBP1933734.1 putative Mg2+ transporter-C (MgtC) family protein [Ammoniphilus resinae]
MINNIIPDFITSINIEVYLRILLGVFVGFCIGWDRTAKNKPAGIKTYSFVTVASTLLTIVSVDLFHSYAKFGVTMMDPARLAAQIPPALGFIGAGLILKEGRKVSGLTSAAMILFAGGMGICIGAGYYGLVFFTLLLMLGVIKIGNWLEIRLSEPKEDDVLLREEIEKVTG